MVQIGLERVVRVVAIDPGGTTGLVWGVRENGRFIMEGFEEVPFGIEPIVVSVENRIVWARDGWCAWVIEDFVVYAQTAQQLTGARPHSGLAPVYVMGIVETLLMLHGVPGSSIHKQMKAQANVINDDRLRRCGGWIVGKQHARDAYRHAEIYCRKAQKPVSE